MLQYRQVLPVVDYVCRVRGRGSRRNRGRSKGGGAGEKGQEEQGQQEEQWQQQEQVQSNRSEFQRKEEGRLGSLDCGLRGHCISAP